MNAAPWRRPLFRDPRVISVIIPCHGQTHFLGEALESALTQEGVPCEVIVVNDGSPDTAALEAVITPYRGRITYLPLEHQGVSAARNAGLATARGEFVVFLDADDRLLPGALACGTAALEAHPECGLTWGTNRTMDEDGTPLPYHPSPLPATLDYRSLLRGNYIGPPAGVMFRAESLRRVGGFTASMWAAEDWDAYLRIARIAPIHFHDHLVAEYRRHPGNVSKDSRRMLHASLAVLDAHARDAAGNPDLMRAIRNGREVMREQWDWLPRLRRFYEARRDRRPSAAVREGLGMLRRHPARLLRLLTSRIPEQSSA